MTFSLSNHAARIRRSWTARRDLLRAVCELAIARIALARLSTKDLLGLRLEEAPTDAPPPLVDRVAFAIPRVAARLPWRSDCLVQALAARSWLARQGVATSLVMGVRKDRPDDLAAHAWLMAGDQVVTGGDVAGFAPLGPIPVSDRKTARRSRRPPRQGQPHPTPPGSRR